MHSNPSKTERHEVNDPYRPPTPRDSSVPIAEEFPRKKRSRTHLSIAFVVVILYFGSYVALRTRSDFQTREYGLTGVLFTDIERTFQRKNLDTHHLLAVFYGPANLLDRTFFEGDHPISGIMFELTP